ncbi:alpha/beta fold hydrolase [Kitasatospora sp. NPDC093806]|uniref:thioesterase II family protein n=1 Tax=Kitasatospora sp. NPDC093806 TaxID=3155075 RepID=UPI00343CED78
MVAREGPDLEVLRAGTGGFRLICVPFAGGSTRSFARLARKCDPDWTVIGVQPPEHPPRPIRPGGGIDALARCYLDLLDGELRGPGLLFGHSLGAAVVHAMARQRGADWPDGLHLVLSAPPEPGRSSDDLLCLDDRRLFAEAGRRGMLLELEISEKFAVSYIVPVLRRDLTFVAAAGWRPGPVTAPVHLLGGTADRVSPPALLRRLEPLVGARSSRLLEGGHMFAVDHPARTADALADIAQRLLPVT